MPWQGELLKRVEALERRASLKRWTTRWSQHDYVESGLARYDPHPFVANTTATREQLVAAFPWLLGGQERHRNDRPTVSLVTARVHRPIHFWNCELVMCVGGG